MFGMMFWKASKIHNGLGFSQYHLGRAADWGRGSIRCIPVSTMTSCKRMCSCEGTRNVSIYGIPPLPALLGDVSSNWWCYGLTYEDSHSTEALLPLKAEASKELNSYRFSYYSLFSSEEKIQFGYQWGCISLPQLHVFSLNCLGKDSDLGTVGTISIQTRPPGIEGAWSDSDLFDEEEEEEEDYSHHSDSWTENFGGKPMVATPSKSATGNRYMKRLSDSTHTHTQITADCGSALSCVGLEYRNTHSGPIRQASFWTTVALQWFHDRNLQAKIQQRGAMSMTTTLNLPFNIVFFISKFVASKLLTILIQL